MRSITVLLATLAASPAWAADHQEAPAATADNIADLADLYAWHTDDGRLVVITTFGWFVPGTEYPEWDPEMLYGVHIDHDGDHVADHDTWIRFALSAGGAAAVQVKGLPGGDPVVQGEVESTLQAGNGLRVMATERDDPFFFDLAGYEDTLSSGTLSFDSSRDAFAGTNVFSVVLEMDAAAASAGSDDLQLWTTSARLQETR